MRHHEKSYSKSWLYASYNIDTHLSRYNVSHTNRLNLFRCHYKSWKSMQNN